MDQEKKIKLLAKLNPDKTSKRDKTNYFYFYENHGHTMEECRQLKDEIERLIRDEMLRNARKDREEKKEEQEVRKWSILMRLSI